MTSFRKWHQFSRTEPPLQWQLNKNMQVFLMSFFGQGISDFWKKFHSIHASSASTSERVQSQRICTQKGSSRLVILYFSLHLYFGSFGMIQIFAKQFGQGNLVQRDKSQYDSFQGFFRVSNWEQPPTCSLKEMISTKNFPLQGTYFEVDFRFVCTRMPAIHSSSQPAFFCCGIACFSSCSRKILRHLT